LGTLVPELLPTFGFFACGSDVVDLRELVDLLA
jgi:hypothetical protein